MFHLTYLKYFMFEAGTDSHFQFDVFANWMIMKGVRAMSPETVRYASGIIQNYRQLLEDLRDQILERLSGFSFRSSADAQESDLSAEKVALRLLGEINGLRSGTLDLFVDPENVRLISEQLSQLGFAVCSGYQLVSIAGYCAEERDGFLTHVFPLDLPSVIDRLRSIGIESRTEGGLESDIDGILQVDGSVYECFWSIPEENLAHFMRWLPGFRMLVGGAGIIVYSEEDREMSLACSASDETKRVYRVWFCR